ncbi:MAG: 30S ribosomal protein S17 [Candidatus Pacebacteria bacterium]|nr:30S ribosomal protein S17 [Candidatus Paceibacterota bacterium]
MKKTLTGKVVSNKMSKTAVVEVERLVEHPKYRRRYKVHKRYKAALGEFEVKEGDKVIIEECRPISKGKSWQIIKKLTSRAEEAEQIVEETESLEKKEDKKEDKKEAQEGQKE